MHVFEYKVPKEECAKQLLNAFNAEGWQMRHMGTNKSDTEGYVITFSVMVTSSRKIHGSLPLSEYTNADAVINEVKNIL